MKRLLSTIVLMLSAYCSNSQDQENLEKYWKYRDQLRQRFMKIGEGRGESIPMSSIIPGRQYAQPDQTTGSVIHWRDATISLGYYFIILATEYQLLSESGENVNANLNELYYALNAFNRLDKNAESYLRNDNSDPVA